MVDKASNTDSGNARPPMPYRRYIFAVGLVVAIFLLAKVAVDAGLALARMALSPDGETALIGTIALVVSPAGIALGTFGAVLASLMRDERS